eukprot:m.253797 g.253797  ORF g.253797 m.253797 type:complete len:1742 (+) comp16164_c2_seq1:146-5371(+)
MGKVTTHIGLLLWKNATLQARKPISTAFEIGLPTLFMLILAGIRAAVNINGQNFCIRPEPPEGTSNVKDYYSRCQWEPFNPGYTSSTNSSRSSGRTWLVGYTAPPGSMPDASDIMKDTETNFKDGKSVGEVVMQQYTSEELLVADLIANESQYNGRIIGVVFHSLDVSKSQAKYALRLDAIPGGLQGGIFGELHDQGSWLTGLSFPTIALTSGPRQGVSVAGNGRYGSDPGYRENGFLPMQYALNLALASKFGLSAPWLQRLMLNRFPFPEWKDDSFSLVIRAVLPLFLTLTLLFSALSITKNVVSEKESKIRDTLKMMGVAPWMQWFAWFMQYLMFLSISITIITLLAKLGSVLEHSDASLFFVFLFLFIIASINFMFLVSVFFDKASTAAAVAGVIWFGSYLPYRFLTPRWALLGVSDKLGACLLSTTCMCIGANVIGQFEGSGEGIRWETINQAVSSDDPFTFSYVLLMLIVDAVLYAILTLYLDAVFPGQFGVAKPWYFFLPKSLQDCLEQSGSLFRRRGLSLESISADNDDDDIVDLDDDCSNLKAGIELNALRKVFKAPQGDVVAVKGTSLNMYEGQITALLGHNGAGKTTTMSILCGLIPPSSGSAVVNGHDISKNLESAQTSLGFCPQHNTLFESLTVAEHLWFFCKLKLVNDNLVYRSIDEMIADLQLLEKRHVRATSLSGGMKRKLSCGMALVGGSPVVILDEPTSGCDPSARRAIWDLLMKNKAGRTMLLSTHFMDEADILGDRIAIMVEGSVKCAGTSLSLKSHYGIGYNLNVVKEKGSCQPGSILEVVKEYVPNASLKKDTVADVTLALPREHSSTFSKLFEKLEGKKSEFGIQSWGVSATTIDEVFLKVGEDAMKNNPQIVDSRRDEPEHRELGDIANFEPGAFSTNLASGFALKTKQFKALLTKRWLHASRNRWAVVSQLIVPGIFVILALLVARSTPTENSPSRNLNDLMGSYGSNTIVEGVANPNTLHNNNIKLQTEYLNAFDLINKRVRSSMQEMNLNASDSAMSDTLIILPGTDTRQMAVFNRHTMLAVSDAEVNGSYTITGWFNGQGYHTVAEALAFTTNLVLNMEQSGAEIVTENHPLPKGDAEQVESSALSSLAIFVAVVLQFGMSFLGSSFVMFVVTERTSKAKHMQFLGGVDIFTFWTSSLLFDLANYMIPACAVLIIFAGFGFEPYSGERLVPVGLLLITYGLAVIPISYLTSFFFTSAPLAYSRLVLFHVVTGMGAIYTVFILQQTASPDTADMLKTVFLILPNFCFGQGIVDVFVNYNNHRLADLVCAAKDAGADDILGMVCPPEDYLSLKPLGVGAYLGALFLQGIVCFMLVVGVDLNLHRYLWRFARISARAVIDFCIDEPPSDEESLVQQTPHNHEDIDVANERERVENDADQSDIVVLKNLSKEYAGAWCGTNFTAVESLSVGVEPGMCFGLLGVNGAGKTTTFKMLTGDEQISDGTALLDGFNIKKDMTRARSRLGYAPQFDALIELMTGRELLTFFARLRGVPEQNIQTQVNKLTQALGLNKYVDKYSKTYSGGNKRKLSTAIALIGSPPIVLLDEPTSGMDPLARRMLWNVLQSALEEGKCIILTSHSMEECESLCSKLGIMVNGRFKCLGSPQHLKHRFGKGFKVMTKVPSLDMLPELESFLKQKFQSTKLIDKHARVIEWEITESETISNIFKVVEEAKAKFALADYSVSQTTLEQVFIDFARSQEEVAVSVAVSYYACFTPCLY